MGSWRKKTYLFGTVSLALCTVALSGMLHNGHVHAKDEIHRAPVLSGTLETTLYVGDEFDAKKLYNRVLADDLEDGDLTYQIEEVFNDVDTSKAGNHKIQYQVTDSDGNTDILETAVKVVEKESGTEKTIKRELYTLGDASHLTSIGFNRGYGHDRQSLGILLSENGELQIRLVNADEFKDNLEVTFINQDKLTQSTGIIPSSGEWVTLKNTYKVTDENNVESQESRVSVPFIKTPKNKKVQPIIEFKWTEDTKEIPYYRYKDKEDDFFAKWEEIDTPYAIIEGSAATFLVPVVDREKIIGFPGENNPAYRFNTIDEMLEWYADFIEFYDEMVGLDYEAGEFYNQNVRSKFFIYANENGYGQAYYSGDHSAFNGPTLDTYLTKSWLALHEFAHGYEGWLASQEYSLVETTNNILAYYFQQTFLTEGDWGWLLGQYAGENRKERWAKMEEWALKYRQETSTFNEIVKDGEKHYDVSLYMFINLFEKIGEKEGTSAMHSLYRKMANAEGKFLSTGDAIIQGIGDTGNYNLIPYFSTFHITPSQQAENKIFDEDYKILYYLKELVPSQWEAETIRDDLGLSGIYSLVSTDDLAETGYKSTVTINFDIDDIEQIKGKVVLIKNGKKVAKAALITGESISVQLPVGAYEMELPAPNSEGYNYGNEYLIAKKGKPTVEVKYEKETGNPLADDNCLEIRGMSETVFASLKVDTSENKIIYQTEDVNKPHVYFSDTYASVRILSPDDQVIFETSIKGTDMVTQQTQIFDFPVGSKVEVHHEEGESRLRMVSTFSEQVVPGYEYTKDNAYVMTEKGLMMQQWDEAKQNDVFYSSMMAYSEYLVDSMSGSDLTNAQKFHKEKATVVLASQYLSEKEKQEYSEKYGILLNQVADVYSLYEKIDSSVLTGKADSVQASEGPEERAVDGDLSTYWHSNYSGNKQPNLQTGENTGYTILLPENMDIGKLEYLPRGGRSNGIILDYDLYYSTTEDGDDFVKITSNTPEWADNGNVKAVEFDAPNARRIRICATKTGGPQPNSHISAVEFYLYKKCYQQISDKEIYLSNLNRDYQEEERIAPKLDKNAMGENISLKVNGVEKTFEKGIGLQGSTTLVYDLSNRSFDTFSTLLGVEAVAEEGTATVSIYGDDVLLYVTGELSSQANAEKISLSLNGIRQLKFVVESSSDTLPFSLGDAKLYLADDATEMTLQPGEVVRIASNTEIYGELASLTTWTSQDPTIATVDEKGNVVALKSGSTVITGESENKTIACQITVVGVDVKKVKVSKTEVSLIKGQTETLLAQAYPEFAEDITISWESKTPTVATVDEEGTVTAVEEGSAQIVAKASNGVQTVVTVTVSLEQTDPEVPDEDGNENDSQGGTSGEGGSGNINQNQQQPGHWENVGTLNPGESTGTQKPAGSTNQNQQQPGHLENAGDTNHNQQQPGNLENPGTLNPEENNNDTTQKPENDNQNVVGKEFEYKDGKYKVLSNETVSFVKMLGKGKTFTIPSTVQFNGVTYKVTEIQAKAFQKNQTITKVKIGNFVTKIGDSAFEGCKKLKNVTIGKKVSEIGKKAFLNCIGLKKITIPSEVKKIGVSAFQKCKNLKKITFKTIKLTKKTVGKKAFRGIHKKATVKVPKAKLSVYKKMMKTKGFSGKIK